jgi:hypothetical protein
MTKSLEEEVSEHLKSVGDFIAVSPPDLAGVKAASRRRSAHLRLGAAGAVVAAATVGVLGTHALFSAAPKSTSASGPTSAPSSTTSHHKTVKAPFFCAPTARVSLANGDTPTEAPGSNGAGHDLSVRITARNTSPGIDSSNITVQVAIVSADAVSGGATNSSTFDQSNVQAISAPTHLAGSNDESISLTGQSLTPGRYYVVWRAQGTVQCANGNNASGSTSGVLSAVDVK